MTTHQNQGPDFLYPSLEENKRVEAIVASILWKKGDISYKLKPCQSDMSERINKSNQFKYIIKCSRRLGKSYLLCAKAVMQCLTKPHSMVRYAAPEKEALKTILEPIMHSIFADSPEELRPTALSSSSFYEFKNGSKIYMSGVNKGHAEKLRGNACDLFIIDEAGFVNDLTYLMNDVAMPQFLDPNGSVVQGRKLLIAGSPARTPAHEFTEVSRIAEMEGNYSHYDIYAGGYPAELVELFKKEAGGEASTTWKREYLALDVVDSNYALVPEWKPEFVQQPVQDEYFRFYHKYVGLDIGVRDLTVALFAYYDFRQGKLFVLHEESLSGPEMTTQRLAERIKESEHRLFPEMAVHKRVSDVDLLLLNDLNSLHGLYFIPTDKGRLEEMVNEVRIWVNAGRIIVSPECKLLTGSLAYGVWNENRTDFDRIPKYGHFDALAALMYLIRNIDQNINPIPKTYGKPASDWWYDEDLLKNERRDKMKKLFNQR